MRDPAEDNVWPQWGGPDHDKECPRYRWTRTDVNFQCVTLVAARDSERKRIVQEVRDSANFIAAEVRRADGKHTMGAGALGETLAESIAARIAREEKS